MKNIIIVLACIFIVGCSQNKERMNEAWKVYDEAAALSERHQYAEAMQLLDTLDVKYRDCLDQRRKGTDLRLNVMAALTRDSIAADELRLRNASQTVDSLAGQFKKVDLAGTDGYYVDKAVYTGDEMNSTGIQVRVDDEGYCYVIVNVSGRQIGLNSIRYEGVEASGHSMAVEGSEIMSISQEPAENLLLALCDAPAKAVVTLVGTKGKATVTLSEKQIKSIRTTYDYSKALQQKRLMSIRLEKLERQLARLSDQLAMRYAPENEEK